MAKGEINGALEQSKVNSYDAYVAALAYQLQLDAKEDQLTGNLATWVDHVSRPDNAIPIETTLLRAGKRNHVALSSERDIPEALTEESSPADALEFFARFEAKVHFLANNHSGVPPLRRFEASVSCHKLHKEAEYILRNGYWRGGYDPSTRNALRVGVYTAAAVFLVSCVPEVVNTLVAKPTETDTNPTIVFTKQPDVISSPTLTPNSNMPKAPDGVTLQKDAQGYYFDQDGVRYRDTTLTNSLGQERYRGWVGSHVVDSPDNINGGIPLQDPGDVNPANSPFYFLAQNGVTNVPYLHHTQTDSADWGKALCGAIYNDIKDIRYNDMQRLTFAHQFDSLSADFSFLGKEYNWIFGKGYKFIAISWDEADPTTHPDFVETPTDKQFGDAVYRWTIFTEPDGTLVVLGAVQDPTKLTDMEFFEWTLNPMGEAIMNETLPTKQDFSKGWHFNSYPSDFVAGAVKKWNGLTHPYFDIQSNP